MILALSLLASLSLIGALCLMFAGTDLLIARRMQKETEAFYAAEAVLHTALFEISRLRPPLFPEEIYLPPWPQRSFGSRSGRIGSWNYDWKAALVPDSRDRDSDSQTPVVLFNRRFGYPESPLVQGGYPVIQILSAVEHGENRRALAAEVAPVTCDPLVRGAWSAGGELVLEGQLSISGFDHDPDGQREGSPQYDLPGVVARGPIDIRGGAIVTGRPGLSGAAAVSDPAYDSPRTPLQALNAGGTLEDWSAFPPPPPAGEDLDGFVQTAVRYTGPLNGEGILVVHNPRFRPRAYEASRMAVEEGTYTPDYDPGYSHLDPRCQPALLEITWGGTFRGLVIADGIGPVRQEFTLIGALITLGRSPLRPRVEAPLDIRFSRRALEEAGRGPLSHLVGFKSLPGAGVSGP